MKISKFLNAFILLAGWCFWIGSSAQAAEEQVYSLVDPAQPTVNKDKIEVRELFWYKCPHCFKFEPALKKWLKNKPADVEFVRMPAVYSSGKFLLMAQAYYTAEALGVVDKVNIPIFEELHVRRRSLDTEEQLMAFFAKYGVSNKAFQKAFKGFSVDRKVRKARIMTAKYGSSSVPAVVVNGKYRLTTDQVFDFNDMMELVDKLVEKERKAMKPAAGATKDQAGAGK